MSETDCRWLPILLIVLLLPACSEEATPGLIVTGQQAADAIPEVMAVAAETGRIPLRERVTGRVSARNQVEIFPDSAGIIMAVHVEDGDQVQAGDPLLQLRDTELGARHQQALSALQVANARARQAQARLSLAEAELTRAASLHARGLASDVALQDARVGVTMAEAEHELRLAEQDQARSLVGERQLQLALSTIRAPISGVVAGRNAEVGQLADTAGRLFVIGDPENLRVDMTINGRMRHRITVGNPVDIRIAGEPQLTLRSEVDRISPFSNASTLHSQVTALLDNEQGLLRPGMLVEAAITHGESAEGVVIPAAALSRHPLTGLAGVYRVQPTDEAPVSSKPQPVKFVTTRVLVRGREGVSVSGIAPGDRIVVSGQPALTGEPGEKVLVRLLDWSLEAEEAGTLSRTMPGDTVTVSAG